MERGYGTQWTASQHEERLRLWSWDLRYTFCVTLWLSPVPSVGVVFVLTLSSARSVSSVITRSAVVSEEDWLRIQTMFVQDAVTRLERLTIDLSTGECGQNATRLNPNFAT